jgi:hypothetical protein
MDIDINWGKTPIERGFHLPKVTVAKNSLNVNVPSCPDSSFFHNWSYVCPIFLKLHMDIDINWGKTPIERGFHPPKVKVTVAKNRLNVNVPSRADLSFFHINLSSVCPIFMKLHLGIDII